MGLPNGSKEKFHAQTAHYDFADCRARRANYRGDIRFTHRSSPRVHITSNADDTTGNNTDHDGPIERCAQPIHIKRYHDEVSDDER